MRHLIRKILKEESLAKTLVDEIKENGWDNTCDLVGGPENLLSIIGKSKETLLPILLSFFDDFKVGYYGNDKVLSRGGGAIMVLQKEGGFWGDSLRAYNDYIEYVIGDFPYEIYVELRRDLIKSLVQQFPELYSEDVVVYADTGLYQKLDKFKLEK